MKYFDILRIASGDGFSVNDYLNSLEPVSRGFHQEALFNIFYLFWSKGKNRLVPSGGNFSAGTALTIKFDMVKFMNRNVRTGGDISDFTMIDNDKKMLIVFSSKCMTKYCGRSMDIEKIMEKKYEFKTEVRLVVHNKTCFLNDMKKQRDTTPDRSNHIIYDWAYIQNMINVFEGDVSSINKIYSLYNSINVKMRPRFGQYIVSMCTTNLLKIYKKVINGSICRFGKTYCMAFDILNSASNLFIFITSQPKTIDAISSIFNKYDDFKEYKLFNFMDKKSITAFNKIKNIKQKTIIFVSIQTLKSKGKGKLIKNLKSFKPMCLIDEFHNSGETSSTMKVMKKHNLLNSPTVFYSATYEKIKSFYDIPQNAIISWGIEDNIWCSNILKYTDSLRKKYGSIVDDALKIYSVEEIEEHYSKLPRLKFIVDKPSQRCLRGFEIKNKIDKSIGYSFDAVKMIKLNGDKYELVNEDAVVSYFQRMLGGGIKDEAFGVYVPKKGMIDTYKKLCNADNQDYGKIIPVYMGNGIVEGEQKNNSDTIIYQCVECIIACLNKYKKTKLKGLDNYALINYKTSIKDPEAWFDQIVEENPEKTIILFLGNSLTTAITNKYCDLIKLTRRINSYDLFWQIIFRAMNESIERNKKYAYICIDDYQSLGILLTIVKRMKYEGESEACAWRRLLKQNIFNIVDIDYDGEFVDTETYEPFFENAYEIVRDATPYGDNLRRYIQDIDFGDVKLLSKYLVNLIKKDARAEIKKLVKKLKELKEKGIKDGIEVKKIENKIKEKEEEVAANDESNCQEMLSVLLTTYVMLTIEIANINIIDVVNYLKENNKWSIMVERCCKSFGLDRKSSISTIIKLNAVLMDPKNIGIVNEMVATLKEQLKFNKSKQECYNIAKEVIMTTDIERKQNAEVLTPPVLAIEMTSKIPEDAWTKKPLPRIFDTCVGKGVFVSIVYDILWDKLSILIPNEEERRRTILEDMLYFADINPFNIYVTKLILDPQNKYKLNAYCGNSLEMKFNFKFDIVMGNPPYNSSGNTGTGNTIWQHFTKKSLNEWLVKDGYLAYVHPSGWRKPCYKKSQLRGLFKLMTQDNQMEYLEIHGLNDGKKTFNCGTRYDWYVINKRKCYKKSKIIDELGYLSILNFNNYKWLPNYNFKNISKILSNNKSNCLNVLVDSSYHATRKYMNKKKTDIYKYECIHSTPKKGIRYMYSNRNDKGHFGVSKVIFGESGINHVIIDINGKYGMTQGAIAILVSDLNEAKKIKNALLSDKFKDILNSTMFGNFRIDWNIFKSFKRDFWKEFI